MVLQNRCTQYYWFDYLYFFVFCLFRCQFSQNKINLHWSWRRDFLCGNLCQFIMFKCLSMLCCFYRTKIMSSLILLLNQIALVFTCRKKGRDRGGSAHCNRDASSSLWPLQTDYCYEISCMLVESCTSINILICEFVKHYTYTCFCPCNQIKFTLNTSVIGTCMDHQDWGHCVLYILLTLLTKRNQLLFYLSYIAFMSFQRQLRCGDEAGWTT